MVPGSEEILFCGQNMEVTRIAQADSAGHPWYVSRRFGTKNYQDTQYLHRDGVWRPHTKYDGMFSGLYETKDDAVSAIFRHHDVERISTPPSRPNQAKAVSKPKEVKPPVEVVPPTDPSPALSPEKMMEAGDNWRALDKLQALVEKHSSSPHEENKSTTKAKAKSKKTK